MVLKLCVSLIAQKLPYCLLRARAEFMVEAYLNPADFGENRGRGRENCCYYARASFYEHVDSCGMRSTSSSHCSPKSVRENQVSYVYSL